MVTQPGTDLVRGCWTLVNVNFISISINPSQSNLLDKNDEKM